MERREAVKILAERHGITGVDEVYEDGETLLSRAAGCESCLDLLRLLIAACSCRRPYKHRISTIQVRRPASGWR